ncbi:MAG: hypothetical protein WKF50_11520 [Nocardioides sp.]
MHFRHELSYDAPPDAVYAMLADPAFREAVTAAQEVVSAVVSLAPRVPLGTAWLKGDR